MTFDDWWKKNKEVWEVSHTALFCGAPRAFADYVWTSAFIEGFKLGQRSPETTKPDKDKEG